MFCLLKNLDIFQDKHFLSYKGQMDMGVCPLVPVEVKMRKENCFIQDLEKKSLKSNFSKLNKIMFTAGLCMIMAITPIISFATSSSISDLEQEIQEDEQNRDNLDNQIDELEEAKKQMESYMEDLNIQIWDINDKLVKLNEQVAQKEEQIQKNDKKLKKAKEVEEEQFESMKLRIQYMYEMGDSSYAELLVTAGSFSEFLNKTEYVNELAEYDRNMLEDYKQTRQNIANTQKELKEQKVELVELQEQTEAKQDELQNKLDSAQVDKERYASQITEAEQLAQKYEEQINAKRNSLQELKAEEERRRKEEEARRNNTYKDTYVEYEGQADDLVLLATIIYCEAGGEPYEGKLAVGSVVMNRVHSSRFPNSVSSVIYQSGQFTPVSSGRYAVALASGVPQSCYDAAQEVLNGNITGNWLFFRTINGIVQGDYIGGHVFY